MDPSAQSPTLAEVLEAIRGLLRRRGLSALSFSRHAHEQARKRNFGARDAQYVLMNGSIDRSDRDERYGSRKYRVSGTDVDGEDLTVIVAFDPAWERITVITGF